MVSAKNRFAFLWLVIRTKATVRTIFITWVMGDTSITEMQIVKQFEKAVEVIEDYQYPIETTDIEIKTKEEL